MRENHIKRIRYANEIYQQHKEIDVPDTKILRTVFPKYNIFISYRQWMRYKNIPMKNLRPFNQLSLFN
jgi:hypothetical protein